MQFLRLCLILCYVFDVRTFNIQNKWNALNTNIENTTQKLRLKKPNKNLISFIFFLIV